MEFGLFSKLNYQMQDLDTVCFSHFSRRLIGELIGYSSGPASVRPSQCSNIFSETAEPIKAKLYVEPPWVGERKFVRGIWADFHETWYVASVSPVHHRLF